MLHDRRQVSGRRLKQKIIMVVHKAVCMNQRVVSLGCCLKLFKKLLSVADALENRFSLIPASGDMIKRNGMPVTIPVIVLLLKR
jgi:hypothetical protein